MKSDSSMLPFLPDSDPQSRQMAEALELAPANRLVLVDVTSPVLGADELASSISGVARDIAPELATPMVFTPSGLKPETIIALAPWYCDEAMLADLEAATRPGEAGRLVASGVESLHSLLSFGPEQAFFFVDPLRLRKHVLARIPASENGPYADPFLGVPVRQDKQGHWHGLLMLRPRHTLQDVSAASALMGQLGTALASLPKGMTATVAGGPRYAAANAVTIEKDVAQILFWSFIGFALVYLVWVRSPGAFWLLLVPVVAVSCALGCTSAMFPSVSGLAIGFGASVLGLAEDYAVHMHFALRSTDNKEKALRFLPLPLAQGLLVNLSGFAILLLSSLPAVRQLAFFAIISLLCGYALAVTVLPLLPGFATPLLAIKTHRKEAKTPATIPTLLLVILLIAIAWLLLHGVKLDVSPQSMGADVKTIQRDAQYVQQIWGGDNADFYVVRGEDTESAIRRTKALWEQVGNSAPVTTVTGIWPPHEEIATNVGRWRDFVARKGADLRASLMDECARHGLKPTAFTPFFDLLSEPVPEFSPEKLRQAGMGDILDTFVPSEGIVLLLGKGTPVPEAMAEWAFAVSPKSISDVFQRQFGEEKRLVPLAWLSCTVLLFLFFRDVRTTLLAAIPPLCSLVCILAFMFASGEQLTLASLAALPLVLGLTTDHGIMVTHELASGTSLGVNRAVLVSTLTTLLGMGLLAFATHPALRSMGQVIFWGLLLEVPVSSWLLPLLCRRKLTGTGIGHEQSH